MSHIFVEKTVKKPYIIGAKLNYNNCPVQKLICYT